MIQFTSKVTPKDGVISIAWPAVLAPAVAVLLERSREKCGGYLNVRFDLPHRPRSTGLHSQNSRFYGHCEDIAEQVLGEDGKPQYTKDQIHDAMLRMAVGDGYQTYLDLNGVETPLPSAQASVEQMNLVDRIMQRYADTHVFWLTEYVAEGPRKGEVYKSIGGRSIEEMEKYEKAASSRF